MATVKVTLKTGLTIADRTHLEAEIREATAADLIDASDESEKLIATPEGYQLLASPTLVGLNTLRRQVVRIGEHAGPLSLAELRKLSAGDLSLIQETALTLETASLEGALKRGRD